MSYDDWKLSYPPQWDFEEFDENGEPIDPPEADDDSDDATDTDPEKTPILDDPEDPGEHLEPHQPDTGGEG